MKSLSETRLFWRWLILLFGLMMAGCRANPTAAPQLTAEWTAEWTAAGLATLRVASSLPTATATEQPTVTHTPRAIPAGPTATPKPLPYPYHGIEIHGNPDVLPASQAGAHWLRYNALVWHLVEPNEGERRWSSIVKLETLLQEAAAQGQSVILIVRSTPEWAQQLPGVFCGPIKPEKLAAFGAFMADVVARYSAPPFNVKYWELGNEPDIEPSMVAPDNIFGCWGQRGVAGFGGAYYAEMLKAVYPQIKMADPQAQVLIGGLLSDCDPVNPPETQPGSGQYMDCTSSMFLEGILQNGGGDYFDAVSFHAYDYYDEATGHAFNPNWHTAWNTSGPVLIPKARYFRSLLGQYGYFSKVLMNTETALLCGYSGDENYCQGEEFATARTNYLVQSYAAALAEGVHANVWYSLRGWRASGLLDKANRPNLAYQAFQFSADMLNQAAFWGEVRSYPGVRGYEFYNGGDRIWVLWALDEATHTIRLPDAPSAVYDAAGNPLPASQELNLSLAPVYVIWVP